MILKFIFYVPKTHLEEVKEAVFLAGAGKYGAYKNCSWETVGTGQFEPLDGSSPFIGKKHQLSRVEEYRVETICLEKDIDNVIAALKQAHPYEWPVYDAWALTHYSSI
ncbi:MAG: NGG1p interacting factor [Burkholderiales bacterium]|jgi:hypothetical protein|nr:NGG1p interacting factor [Burkholderiales bacterium]